jgi:hypothetical protein
MEDFILYLKMGFNHVLDFSAYDHILFLIVLAVVFSFLQWKKVIWLVTLFTVGHSISLALSAYEIIEISVDLIEFLIPLTILITALVNIFTAKDSFTENHNTNLFFALVFGLIHGLGFSNYFKMMIGKEENKLMPLLEFAMGIEAAQIIIVLGFLIIATVFQYFLGVRKRDWILVVSSIVIGFAIQMMADRVFW